MPALCRGGTAAIAIFMCAVAWSSAALGEIPSEPVDEPIAVGESLLRDSENSPAIDPDWVLRHDHGALPEVLFEQAPLSDEVMMNTALKPVRTPLPHVDTPAANDEPADVNDRLVPVPVLSVGWAIVLCVFLFNLGAKVLGIRKPSAR